MLLALDYMALSDTAQSKEAEANAAVMAAASRHGGVVGVVTMEVCEKLGEREEIALCVQKPCEGK